MRTLTGWSGLAPEDRGAAVAIGNFDGVHRGHRAVIDRARAVATSVGCPLGVVTFEPHPREVFVPESAPFRLMNAEARAHRLEKLGVERLYELPFDARVSGLTAEDFAREVLAEGIGAAHAVVGADFRFGKGRTGTAEGLRDFGLRYGFGVTVADLVLGSAGRVSSTAIRAALGDGRPREAATMLGHWHRIEGPVLHGDKRGRDLGYPTANMALTGLHPPRFGVYAVLVDVLSGPHRGSHHGAASLGIRPMFETPVPTIETYLFDFAGDLYDTHLSVGLVEFLRPEAKFDSLDALVIQMRKDCARARDILAAL